MATIHIHEHPNNSSNTTNHIETYFIPSESFIKFFVENNIKPLESLNDFASKINDLITQYDNFRNILSLKSEEIKYSHLVHKLSKINADMHLYLFVSLVTCIHFIKEESENPSIDEIIIARIDSDFQKKLEPHMDALKQQNLCCYDDLERLIILIRCLTYNIASLTVNSIKEKRYQEPFIKFLELFRDYIHGKYILL